jgi:hypothetical protein
MIRRIFEVNAPIQYTDDGTPFLLPQMMRALASGTIDRPSQG